MVIVVILLYIDEAENRLYAMEGDEVNVVLSSEHLNTVDTF